MLNQAVILAGGRGTRLGAITNDTPKPMLPVAGIPCLEYLVRSLRAQGITRVTFSVGYLHEAISSHFGEGEGFGVTVDYIVEEEAAGTGGFLSLGKDLLDERFFVLNGDTLFDADLITLARHHREQGVLASMALRRVADVGRFGEVHHDEGRIHTFSEKGGRGEGLINGGIYILDRSLCDRVTALPCSMEKEILPVLAEQGELFGAEFSGFFLDIGLPDSYASAQAEIPRWWSRPIAFLDRDGVININHGYVCSTDRFDPVPGVYEAIKTLREQGYRIVVVTNQAGIARGYYTEETFKAFMLWLREHMAERHAGIDAYYFCPHHPEAGKGEYLQTCTCRKPAPDMLRWALADFGAEPGQCFLIGDKDSDIAAATAMGIAGHKFPEDGNLATFVRELLPTLS